MSQSPDKATFHIPQSFASYRPELSSRIKGIFPLIRFEEAKFDNLMPLLLAGKHLTQL